MPPNVLAVKKHVEIVTTARYNTQAATATLLGCSQSTVSYHVTKEANFDPNSPPKRRGRPPKFDKHDLRHLRSELDAKDGLEAAEMVRYLKTRGYDMSLATLARYRKQLAATEAKSRKPPVQRRRSIQKPDDNKENNDTHQQQGTSVVQQSRLSPPRRKGRKTTRTRP